MTLSVIIPTYNGRNRLPKILESLALQTCRDSETIVVVDGSTDDTAAYLAQWQGPIALQVHHRENGGRAVVRNAGAALAKGDLLLFFDDDMRLRPDCIQAHLDHHHAHPGSILTGAQIDDPALATTDFGRFKCALSLNWREGLLAGQGRPQQDGQVHLTAANLSLPQFLFKQLGGFDERLRDCEDYDLALRAQQQGVPLYYSEAAFGWHDDLPSVYSFIRRQREYRAFNRQLLQQDPQRYRHLLQSRLRPAGTLRSGVNNFFRQPFWLSLIHRDRLRWLPLSIRYRIYDLVVTAQAAADTPAPQP